MLSSLTKLADKNFVIGFFLPALLAIFAAAFVFTKVPALIPINQAFSSEKSLADLAWVVLGTWVLAVLLMTANHMLYRLLQGYLPPVSWLLPLLWWQRRRYSRLKRQYDAVIASWGEARAQQQVFPLSMQERATRLRAELLENFPPNETDVLPTRFGNTIRSFEMYPREVYGVDSVPVWLRLASVISKDFTALIDDARAQVDCFVNIACLSFAIAAASLADALKQAYWDRLLFWQIPITFAETLAILKPLVQQDFTVPAIGFAVAFLSYRWATIRVVAWGDLVKSAFDCYLPALAKQLGFALPRTDAERREFWSDFNALILYQQKSMTPDRWPLVGDSETKK